MIKRDLINNIYIDIIDNIKTYNKYIEELNDKDIELKGEFLEIDSIKYYMENHNEIPSNITKLRIKLYDINPPIGYIHNNIKFILIFNLDVPFQNELPKDLIRLNIVDDHNNLSIDKLPINLQKIKLIYTSLKYKITRNFKELHFAINEDDYDLLDGMISSNEIETLMISGKYYKSLDKLISTEIKTLKTLKLMGNIVPEINNINKLFPTTLTKLSISNTLYNNICNKICNENIDINIIFPNLMELSIYNENDNIKIIYNDKYIPDSLIILYIDTDKIIFENEPNKIAQLIIKYKDYSNMDTNETSSNIIKTYYNMFYYSIYGVLYMIGCNLQKYIENEIIRILSDIKYNKKILYQELIKHILDPHTINTKINKYNIIDTINNY